ncbi:CorA metal ion transporter [Lunasporangiospora selenospora]|uniref:CorA metal ion transporter n=1 Tax=Lunasporangiospora selenospora TaxID=979761 RepID=A0A9P6KEF3_9FUNG|nr:CorA metal ion transporter [Lunasporangiospora selenospora]
MNKGEADPRPLTRGATGEVLIPVDQTVPQDYHPGHSHGHPSSPLPPAGDEPLLSPAAPSHSSDSSRLTSYTGVNQAAGRDDDGTCCGGSILGRQPALAIDYSGLDGAVADAMLFESGIPRSTSFNPTNFSKDTKGSGVPGAGISSAIDTMQGAGFSIGSASPMVDTDAGVQGSEVRRRSARKSSFYSEKAPRPPLPDSLRYTFFTRSTGVVQAPSLPQILARASFPDDPVGRRPSVFSDLLKNGCYWLDILDPSDFDMQIIAKDISTEDVREKYEVFRHYYFVCFRTFDQDYNSGSYLQPASMYSIVMRDGIITFHFRPTNHHMNVLRRMEQMHSHITLTPDWINYALLDDITDIFASPIQTVEYEVDSIDELVLLLRENETTDMLRRIGSCRKNVMTMTRLLSNKADVIRGLMKRFDDRYTMAPLATTAAPVASTAPSASVSPTLNMNVGTMGGVAAGVGAGTGTIKSEVQETASTTTTGGAPAAAVGATAGGMLHTQYSRDGEIMLYLGDILDHVLTMLQSLASYDKILDRSHSNYLAQISLEINQLSNKTNEVVGTLTFFASLIVPMTFISGLWGMNVQVPGQGGSSGEEPLFWWWGILGVMGVYCVVAVIFGKRYGLI